MNDGGPGIAPQIRLDVTQVGSNDLCFFQNLGPFSLSITHIVFADPANILNRLLTFDNTDRGVAFAAFGTNMPQGNGLEEFGVRSTSPRSGNGVQPVGYLGLTYSLNGTFASRSNAMNLGLFDVVMHVQQTNVGSGSDVLVSAAPQAQGGLTATTETTKGAVFGPPLLHGCRSLLYQTPDGADLVQNLACGRIGAVEGVALADIACLIIGREKCGIDDGEIAVRQDKIGRAHV